MSISILREVLESTITIETKSIENLKKINIDNLLELVELIWKCEGNIFITGVGTSGAAAKKIAHTLSCIEIPAFYLSPQDCLHGRAGVLKKDDIVIVLSKGGKTEEMEKLLPIIIEKHIKMVCISENENSKLAKKSHIFIKIDVEKEADPFNMLATSSTLMYISLFDIITITIMKLKNFSKEQFLLIHPGGAVGKKLLDEVKIKQKN